MGADVAERFPGARAVFDAVDDALGFSLSRIMWEGPADQLTLTHNAQPAILTHTLAVHAVVAGVLAPVAAAGHSLGEYSAYAAAGALEAADAARLVRRRGELMSEAGEQRPGTMAVVMGLETPVIEDVCREASDRDTVVVAANINAPGQVVISGDPAAVDRAGTLLKNAGAKRVLPLNVSGAFHSPLMEPAQVGLRGELEQVPLASPAFPIIANASAEAVSNAEDATRLLGDQVTRPRAVGGIDDQGSNDDRFVDAIRRDRTRQCAVWADSPNRRFGDVDGSGYGRRNRRVLGGARMTIHLDGRVAVITGGSRGIGRAIATRFASAGAHVAVVARDAGRASEAAAALPGDGKRVGLGADVSNVDQVAAMIANAEEALGPTDVLVNNAGVTRDGVLVRMGEDDWQTVLDTNLKGAFTTTKAVIRGMMKRRSGRIINISSVVGLTGNRGQANYAASKAGLIGFSKSVAKELASRNILVNAVAPGFIDTDMTAELPEEARAALMQQIPLGRLGSVEDVAGVVAFLASDLAGYITGQVLVVDGGMVM